MRGVVVEVTANATDMCVKTFSVVGRGVGPDRALQFVLGHDGAAGGHERKQDVELGGREVDCSSMPPDTAASRPHLERTPSQRVTV